MLKFMKAKGVSLYIIFFLCNILILNAQEIIHIPLCGKEDVTSQIRESVLKSKSDQIKIVFEKGIYHCSPDYAIEKYCAISNHGNGTKKILFSLENYKTIEIIGNAFPI